MNYKQYVANLIGFEFNRTTLFTCFRSAYMSVKTGYNWGGWVDYKTNALASLSSFLLSIFHFFFLALYCVQLWSAARHMCKVKKDLANNWIERTWTVILTQDSIIVTGLVYVLTVFHNALLYKALEKILIKCKTFEKISAWNVSHLYGQFLDKYLK